MQSRKAKNSGVPMWVCQAVRLVLKHGVFQGRGRQDMSRVVEIVEDGARAAQPYGSSSVSQYK